MAVFVLDMHAGTGIYRYQCTQVRDIVGLLERVEDLKYLRVELVDAIPVKRTGRATVEAAS